MSSERDILEKLKESILTYEFLAAEEMSRKAMEERVEAVVVANALTEAIRQVGDAFGRGEIFLPELLGAAKAGKCAMSVIEEELRRTAAKRESTGTLVIGTVKGDIHDIGKNIVATLFYATGFEVVDLGVDVSPEAFAEAVKQHKPDILGMSALLTTTAPQQRSVIEHLEKSGMRNRVRVIVGGAAISQVFAEEIGADGYGETAFEAVEVATRLLEG